MEESPAGVVARAIAPESGAPLPLVDLLEGHLAGGAGAIAILGPPGSGKTTALRQVAARWPDAIVLDEPRLGEVERASRHRVVVYTSPEPLLLPHRLSLKLAPWGDDEILEYLMVRHRDACASVMERLDDRTLPAGSPEVWSALLDAMAADRSIASVAAALAASFPEERAQRLRRHRPFRIGAALAALRASLRRGDLALLETTPLDPELLRVAGSHLADDRIALATLLRATRIERQQAVAASLLHAAGATWRPKALAGLSRARLAGIAWRGAQLWGATLSYADLRGADLTEARLDHAVARGVLLMRATLHGASMVEARFLGGRLAGADLSSVRAHRAQFLHASLASARLDNARLDHADFSHAVLAGASLARASLVGAHLRGARLDDADLTGACLDHATLSGVSLRACTLDGASFVAALMQAASLAGIRLPGAAMARAQLVGADLTAAHLPDARMAGANLRGALLADICLERANLRDCDLRKAHFHMGPSRSGLVESVIPSEGSRTGFYTDESAELHFKSPEEVRKADLRGADLRGAKLDGTDFYLVDLRGARYDTVQADHLRRCGAILRAQV